MSKKEMVDIGKGKKVEYGSHEWRIATGKAKVGSDLWIEGRVGHYVEGLPVGLSPLAPENVLKGKKGKK